MYLLKLALRPWRLSPLSQLFSGLAVGFLLILAGFFVWVNGELRPVSSRLQGEQVVTAFLDPQIDSKGQARLADEIRVSVGSSAVDVKLVSADGFLKELGVHYPELARELDDIGPEGQQLLPRYFSISGVLPSGVIERLRGMTGIESVESSKDRYRPVVGAFVALQWVSRLLVAGICFALLTGLLHLSRMNATLHHDAVSLLRLWGASAWTQKTPGLLSGLGVGLLGGAIASASWAIGGAWMASQLRSLSPLLAGVADPGYGLAILLLASGATVGILSGALGSEIRRS